MKTIEQKLAKVEADLKRWQTRLKRATTKVTELDRQRRRLSVAKVKPPTSPVQKKALAESLDEAERSADGHNAGPAVPLVEGHIRKGGRNDVPDDFVRPAPPPPFKPADDLDMPAFLVRPKQQQGTDEERRAMPLSGRAAMLKILSDKVSKKRAKRDRAFQKK